MLLLMSKISKNFTVSMLSSTLSLVIVFVPGGIIKWLRPDTSSVRLCTTLLESMLSETAECDSVPDDKVRDRLCTGQAFESELEVCRVSVIGGASE